MNDPVRVLIPSGALGLGYDRHAMQRGLETKPHIIAIDGGSTDSGPSYLGRAVSKYSRASVKTEWRELMQARAEAGIALLLGTAGTCGADATVDWMLEITRELAAELGQTLKIATIRCSQDPGKIAAAFDEGRLAALPHAPPIDTRTINGCENIVALAGCEQIAAALETGADIVICGRATDTAIIAALPLMRGCHDGGAWHGAKIGECGALCTTNPQSGVIVLEFDETGFCVEPMAEGASATPHTVSAHMLYENANPFILHEPGGHLDVTDAIYEQLDDRRVRVSGSKWVPSKPYTVKLEGAAQAGFQCVSLALLRDPHYVENAQVWARDIEQKCHDKIRERLGLSDDDFSIELRLMGKDASFGALETSTTAPFETGVLAISTAQTQQLASEIAQMLNPYLLHHPLTESEELPTFAFPFSPAEMNRGAIYEFRLNHVLHLDDPMDAFQLDIHHLDQTS